MTVLRNAQDHTSLTIEHDAHGCTILAIQPLSNDGTTPPPVVYGIPEPQLPAVLFEMMGGQPTEEEQSRALEFLNEAAQATPAELQAAVREAMLALTLRLQADAAMARIREEKADAEGAATEPDTTTPDPLDDMSRTELLAEAKNWRGTCKELERRYVEVVNVLQAIHNGISTVISENQGNADA